MKSKRNFEYIVHLGSRDAQLERGIDEADRRRHAKTRAHPVIGQVAREFHEALGRPISSCASRSAARHGIGILGLDAAARKTDLSGMILERGGALREQHGPAALALDQRHQHGSRDPSRGRRCDESRKHLARSAGEPQHVLIRRGRGRIERLADMRLGIKRIHRYPDDPGPFTPPPVSVSGSSSRRSSSMFDAGHFRSHIQYRPTFSVRLLRDRGALLVANDRIERGHENGIANRALRAVDPR